VYPTFFGLKEPSFSITPDPQYLFLSEQHREALAHLLYGAGESGGFVLLTGEVGTGKTTICRAFLEQLPEDVDLALILNPAMTVTELLRAICDEFRIFVPDNERTVKRLVDRLNEFLLAAHAQGRRAVLMIDEAQNLRPRLLEQIRLLTNLETPKHKLLQIFLVGQPELRTLLQREGLRQLDQRITARYHLRPFTARDTAEYVRHRLAVAGVERMLFTRAALREVQRYTGGVPRLINILCDRALLGAFVSRSPVVTPKIVAHAAREVRAEGSRRKDSASPRRPYAMAASLVLALGAGWLARDWWPAEWEGRLGDATTLMTGWIGAPTPAPVSEVPRPEAAPTLTSADEAPSAEPPVEAVGPPAAEDRAALPRAALAVPVAIAPVAAAPESEEWADEGDAAAPGVVEPAVVEQEAPPDEAPPTGGEAAAESMPEAAPAVIGEPPDLERMALDLTSGLRVLLRRWGLELGDPKSGDPCGRLTAFGLRCERAAGDWVELQGLGLPALIMVSDDAGRSGHLVVGAVAGDQATVDLPEASERFTLAALSEVWDGRYLVVWQPPPFGSGVIGPRSSGDAVRWLRKMLAQLPEQTIPSSDSGRYDRELTEAVREFQASQGLAVDGIAGPRTLIRLGDVLAVPGIPRLRPES
jgi:general secretion pathway protein A